MLDSVGGDADDDVRIDEPCRVHHVHQGLGGGIRMWLNDHGGLRIFGVQTLDVGSNLFTIYLPHLFNQASELFEFFI